MTQPESDYVSNGCAGSWTDYSLQSGHFPGQLDTGYNLWVVTNVPDQPQGRERHQQLLLGLEYTSAKLRRFSALEASESKWLPS